MYFLMRLERYKQIREIWLSRDDFKTQISDINESIIGDIGYDIIKEYLTKKIVEWNLRIDQIDDLRFKILKLEWIEYKKDLWLYTFLYSVLINNILLPSYVSWWNKEDIFEEFDQLLENVNDRTSKILKNINNWGFFNISVWNHDEIENELDWVFNNWWYIEYRTFNLGWVFWFIHIWENPENLGKYTFRISVKIPWWVKQKIWDKEVLDKTVNVEILEKILSELFDWKNSKRNISKNNKFFKWLNDYYIYIKRSLNKDNSCWFDDSATFYIIDILNSKLSSISDDKYSTKEVIVFLDWFFQIANVVINKIATESWIHHKDKYLNFSTMYEYLSSDDKTEDYIDNSILEKFSKLLVEMKKPIKLDDIWWQENAKKEIYTIIKSIKHEEIMKSWWSKTTTWIIFEWPPWTWKTLLAQAIATEVNAQVYNIKLTDIASTAYINEGSNNLKELFKFLRYKASKSTNKIIVILDELDALFKKRNSQNQSWEDIKIVNTFLTEMSWFDNIDNIIFVWTTNYIENLDEAVIRSWRMSTKIKVYLPDFEARKQIFTIHINKIKKLSQKANSAFNWINLDNLSNRSDWLSWADIEEIIRQVVELKAIEEVDTWKFTKITEDDIYNSIKKIKFGSDSNKLSTIWFIQP